MIELFGGRLHIASGRREWEIQGYTESGYLQFTGAPHLTKAQALRVLPVWQGYEFLAGVVAVNVRTGERIGTTGGRQ